MPSKAVLRTWALGVWLALLIAITHGQTTSGDTNTTSTTTTGSSEGSTTVQEQLDTVEKGVNASWLILTGALVFFMQAGFAILEAGAVSKSDTRNILFKNLLDVCCTGLGWWALGFGFAFGNGDSPSHGFIGNRFFFSTNFPDEKNGLGYAFWFFEFCFAAASATIVSGAVAERATFQVYILWSLISSLWVYPVIAHWEWSGQGWLSATNPNDPLMGIGMIDFAGCGAVHMVGGGGALIGAIVSGMRNKKSKVAKFKPRFEKVNNKWLVNDIPGRSDIFASLGSICLWFSWYGFNCGSTLLITTEDSIKTASRIAATTTLAACAAGLTCVILGRALSSSGHFNLNDANNGILAGLVSITAGCATVEPWAAVIIGFFGAIFFKFGSFLMLKLRIDDPVDAAPLHFGCGIWGLLSCGIFAAKHYMQEVYGHSEHYGLFMGGGGKQLGAQFIGMLAVGAWTLFWALLFWVPVKYIDKRRQQRIFFIEEDVTGGVDQRFISLALTQDLHHNLANIADLASEGSLNNIEMDAHPGINRQDSLLGERDKDKEEIYRMLTLNPSKRKAFLDFLNTLEEDQHISSNASDKHNISGSNKLSNRSQQSRSNRDSTQFSSGTPSNQNSGTHIPPTLQGNNNQSGNNSPSSNRGLL